VGRRKLDDYKIDLLVKGTQCTVFVLMDVYVIGVVLFISTIYWNKSNYLSIYSVKSLNTSPLSPNTRFLKILHNIIYCFVSNGQETWWLNSINLIKSQY
jgi:hypothetical protein